MYVYIYIYIYIIQHKIEQQTMSRTMRSPGQEPSSGLSVARSLKLKASGRCRDKSGRRKRSRNSHW